MKKIFFVINSMEGGGAERALAKLLSQFEHSIDRSMYQITLVLLDDLEVQQVIPSYVIKKQLNAKGGLFSSIVQLSSLVRSERPDVLVSFLTRANCASVIVGKQCKIPVLISERVNTSSHLGSQGLGAKLNKLIVRTLYPLANKVLVVSGGVGIDLVENFNLKQEKVKTIHNSVDPAALKALADEQAITTDRPYIIALGRLVPNKNFSMLISAYHKAELDVDLWILGQGPLESELKEQVEKLGLTHRIKFLGFQKNPYPYLKACEFYVSASNAEGFPNTLVEAMAFSKAVLFTNCASGPSEILDNQDTMDLNTTYKAEYGILTPTNDEESFVKGLHWLNDNKTREHYQEQSDIRIAEYTPVKFALAYWEEIERVLDASSCG